MRHRAAPASFSLPVVLLVLVALLDPTTAASAQRTLTFAERVAAREAIERVYYSHRLAR
jgi:hypothetical protein